MGYEWVDQQTTNERVGIGERNATRGRGLIVACIDLKNQIRTFWFCCHMLSGSCQVGQYLYRSISGYRFFNFISIFKCIVI